MTTKMELTTKENLGELCKECRGEVGLEFGCSCHGTGWQLVEAYKFEDERTKRIRDIVEKREKEFHGKLRTVQNTKRN